MRKGWEIRKLCDVASVSSGNSAPQKRDLFEDGIYPFIRTSDVGQIKKGFISACVDYLNKDGIKGLKLFKKGTILFPKSGASTFLNHRVMMEIDSYVSSHLATIKANNAIADDRFLLYYLTTIDARDLMQDIAYPSLKISDIGLIEIPLPSLSEQKSIVAILDEAFAAIDKAKTNIEKNLQNAKEFFESHLQSVFENRGSAWEERTLGEVAKHSLGKMLDKNKNKGTLQKYLRNQSVRWFDFDLSDLTEMPFLESEKEKYSAIKGDVMICEGGYPGRAAIWQEDYPIFFQKAIHRVRFHKIEYNKWFLYYLYISDKTGNLKTHFSGTGIQHFTGEALNKFIVPIPPVNKVEAIVRKFDVLLSQTKKLETIYQKKLNDLEVLKKSILQNAFNGELTYATKKITA